MGDQTLFYSSSILPQLVRVCTLYDDQAIPHISELQYFHMLIRLPHRSSELVLRWSHKWSSLKRVLYAMFALQDSWPSLQGFLLATALLLAQFLQKNLGQDSDSDWREECITSPRMRWQMPKHHVSAYVNYTSPGVKSSLEEKHLRCLARLCDYVVLPFHSPAKQNLANSARVTPRTRVPGHENKRVNEG